MNDKFSIVLTSTTGRFNFNLTTPVRFARPYECACVEFNYSTTWFNFETASMTIYPTADETTGGVPVSIPKNYYRNLYAFLSALRDNIRHGYKKYFTINKVDNRDGSYTLSCVPSDAKTKTDYKIDDGAHIVLDDYLKNLLNMDTNVLQQKINGVANLCTSQNKKIFLLETDFTSYNYFNNTQKSYLLVTQIPCNQYDTSPLLTKQPVSPLYVALRDKQSLQNFTIATKFENGETVSFAKGTHTLTLHFRPIV